MNLDPDAAELLQYLADLGWTDLYLAMPAGAPQGAPDRAAAVPGRGGVGPAAAQKVSAVAQPVAPGPERLARLPPFRNTELRAELEELALKVSGCRECKLCTTRTQTVFASGDPCARLMLVGEGPGAEEDRQGLPFVGAAGELLNKILAAIGLERAAVYVANIVKCRPPGNRDPEPDEVRACRGYLERQIDLVRPAVIVALGRIAAHELLGNDFSLTRLRGEWHQVRGIPVRVTYHPAALLRNAAYKRPAWEDMQAVRDHLRSLPDAADANASRSADADRPEERGGG